MKLNKALEGRRSIRSYKDKPIEKDQIKKLVRAAMLAPSWKNTETARFYAVLDDDKLATMRENCLPEFNAQRTASCPALIVTGYVKGQSGHFDGQPADELGDAWGMLDLGLAIENMLLEAYAMDLGTLIMGARNEAAVRKLLSIPEDIVIGPIVAVGYANEEPKMPERNKLKNVLTFE